MAEDNITERVMRLEDRVNDMAITMSTFAETIKRFDKAIDKLDSTLNNLQETFIEMRLNSQNNAINIKELREVSKKNEDDKNLNLAVFVKDNILWIAIVVILGAKALGLL